MKYGLKKELERICKMRLYDGEQGAGGGDGSPAPESGAAGAPDAGGEPADVSLPTPDFGDPSIPESVRKSFLDNDPDLQNMVRGDNATKKKTPAKSDGDKKGTDTDHDAKGDQGGKQGPEGKDKTGPKEGGDDKNSDAVSDETDLEFADNVIEGLKGEHLKALPAEAQDALAKFHEKATAWSEGKTKAETRLNQLLADPVIKAREAMIATGKTKYADYALTETEKNEIISEWKTAVGLDQTEADALMSKLDLKLEKVVESRVTARFNNRLVQDEGTRKKAETRSKARNVFLELGKLNPELSFNEKDGNAFWKEETDDKGEKIAVLNTDHPEYEKFQKKIMPILKTLAEMGIGYEGVVKMASGEKGLKSLYAYAGALLDLPVSINADGVIKNAVLSDRAKLLKRFLKGGSGGELSVDSKSSIASKLSGGDKPVMKDGYDIVALYSGGDAYDRAVMEKPGNSDHAAKIARLAEEGATYLRSKQKRKT